MERCYITQILWRPTKGNHILQTIDDRSITRWGNGGFNPLSTGSLACAQTSPICFARRLQALPLPSPPPSFPTPPRLFVHSRSLFSSLFPLPENLFTGYASIHRCDDNSDFDHTRKLAVITRFSKFTSSMHF